jgi:hypothetical protein
MSFIYYPNLVGPESVSAEEMARKVGRSNAVRTHIWRHNERQYFNPLNIDQNQNPNFE